MRQEGTCWDNVDDIHLRPCQHGHSEDVIVNGKGSAPVNRPAPVLINMFKRNGVGVRRGEGLGLEVEVGVKGQRIFKRRSGCK